MDHIQKARCDWAQFGDRNTRFFHTAAIIRRKKNKIEALTSCDGTLVTDQVSLKCMIVDYFRKLYEATESLSTLSTSTTFPSLSSYDLLRLEGIFSDIAIKDVVFSIGPLKALGPDGLQPIFFQSQWDIIGSSVCDLVRKVYLNPDMVCNLNETLVVLIPKVQYPETLNQSRPISLCNVVYKIVTKVVTNRFRRHMASLIAPHKCSFIPGRHNSENIVIAQEIFHTMRSKKGGKKGFIAVKVDLDKAYDRLRWEFIDATLQELGLGEHFRKLIMVCVSTVVMRVLFNGDTTETFFLTKDIRQEDPISPYLFILCVEKLAIVSRTWWRMECGNLLLLTEEGLAYPIYFLPMICYFLGRQPQTRCWLYRSALTNSIKPRASWLVWRRLACWCLEM